MTWHARRRRRRDHAGAPNCNEDYEDDYDNEDEYEYDYEDDYEYEDEDDYDGGLGGASSNSGEENEEVAVLEAAAEAKGDGEEEEKLMTSCTSSHHGNERRHSSDAASTYTDELLQLRYHSLIHPSPPVVLFLSPHMSLLLVYFTHNTHFCFLKIMSTFFLCFFNSHNI